MRLSVQLYTVRDSASKDLVGTLQGVRRAGLEYVELAGLYGLGAEGLRELLEETGLRAMGAHESIHRLREDFQGAVEDSKQLGYEWLIVPYVEPEWYRDGWGKLAEELNRLGVQAQAAGVRLAYHNHSFEFTENGYDFLLSNTDPDLVAFELDVAWALYAGRDPAELLLENGHRMPLVHLKDITRDPQHLHIEAGRGIVDWCAVLPACESVEVQFGCIELDEPPGDPVEAVRGSAEYFQSKAIS